MKKLLTALLIFGNSTIYAQKLALDTTDNGMRILQTNWSALHGEDGSIIKIMLKRTGGNIKLYCMHNRRKDAGPADAREHFEFSFSGGEKIEVPITRLPPAEVSAALEDRINGVKRNAKLTDEPDAINSDILTDEQLTLLGKDDLEQLHIYFYGSHSRVIIKQKDRHVLRSALALVQ